MRGRMISLEGIDFTWKTPFSQWLARDLSSHVETLITRDPPYALSPWNSFREFFERGDSIAKISEAIMLLALRLDNTERVIKPAIEAGKLIISDRFLDSWFAYQSIRISKLFENEDAALEYLINVNLQQIDKNLILMPDLTIWIYDDPEVTTQRINSEKEVSKYDNLDFQQKVSDQYEKIAQIFPERIIKLDVRGKTIDESYAVLKKIAENWLNSGKSIIPNIESLAVGQRLMAINRISWTVDEFEDYPLIIESGDEGVVKIIYKDDGVIQVEWDKDSFKRRPKTLNLNTRERYSAIII